MSKSNYARVKQWRARNKEKWHAYRKKYHLLHKEAELAKGRVYYLRQKSMLKIPLLRVEETLEWVLV